MTDKRDRLNDETRRSLKTPPPDWERDESMEEFVNDGREYLDRETLQRFLSDLARLGARYGVELVPDADSGVMRLAPLSPEQGGYLAERIDDGPRVLSSYGNDVQWEDPTNDIVGDSFHPIAREQRARIWLEENAEALDCANSDWFRKLSTLYQHASDPDHRNDDETERLRELLAKRRRGRFVSTKEAERRTRQMIARKRRSKGLRDDD
ncbi:hypothetical protein [Pontibaca salina]|uniref:Uncharacterized protein n=1 Tax=Pontibaca salina TaxID=2795731 RepID=A0A934HUU5_9RHOB|nr:hypothetical protein [Pontibaca salina]MBI6630930.1 hypothetical protein [Pontibaca salina]